MTPVRCCSILLTSALVGLLFCPAPSRAEEPGFQVTDRYTAQRKPRVTVLEFEDTNSVAQREHFGAAVEAMLVTFLKRQSQLVVVERQKMEVVLQEWKRNQGGLTEIDLQQDEQMHGRELLEKIDGIILGNVTLLDHEDGQRIEIDAKLLARADGRIIAVAQRSGSVGCLRSIVARLAVALEREFLRPYYGRLQFKLREPENVRLFLTPILLDTAVDEEKPPVESGSTVIVGGERDEVEAWMTDPTTYTIDNVLSGWYSMRLERPGYEGLGTENARWQARELFGRVEVYERTSGRSLPRVAPELARFVVRVDPLRTDLIDGDLLGFEFRKKVGSFEPLVLRELLDEEYVRSPEARVMLIGNAGLELNQLMTMEEYAEEGRCDLFLEKPSQPAAYGRTHVSRGQSFDVDSFPGGLLAIEDYQGETLPAGVYEQIVWAPHYVTEHLPVTVRDGDRSKPVGVSLIRSTGTLHLETTGPLPSHELILTGEVTGQRVEIPLDFEQKERHGIPVDRYRVTTDIPGFGGWSQAVDLLPPVPPPPSFDPDSQEDVPLRKVEIEPMEPPRISVKTRIAAAGRLQVLTEPRKLEYADYHLEPRISWLLNDLLGREDDELDEGFWRQFGKAVAVHALSTIHVNGQPLAQPQPNEPPPPVPAVQEAVEDPRHRAALRQELDLLLRDLDLLLLDEQDMSRLRGDEETTKIIRQWLDGGGTLFAFVTEPGDYGGIVGAPLTVAPKPKPSNRFELGPGDVARFRVEVPDKSKVLKRPLPELVKIRQSGAWRILASGKGRGDARIIERGRRDDGGYVVVWAEHPGAFRKKRIEEIDAVREKLEDWVMSHARYLMYRRYDTQGEQRTQAEQALGR